MKKIIILIGCLASQFVGSAQNEGRFGIISGVNKTSMSNAADNSFGDMLPTFKPTYGVEAGYHFTLFKSIPTGFTVQLTRNHLGQNYRGYYQDSSDYWAYRRLNYVRAGLGWHFGTNVRRQVSATFTFGATLGMLTNFQDRYELRRYNNDRLIMDINNNDVSFYDTKNTKGTINNSLFNKTDMTIFASIGMDFLLSKRVVFGVLARYDNGISPVENTASKFSINYQTTPTTIQNYYPYNTKLIYRSPVDATKVLRQETVNKYAGIYLTLKYRVFNKEKIEFWYKEHQKSNYY